MRRTIPVWAILVLSVGSIAGPGPAARPKQIKIESLRWLAGCWESVDGDRVFQEQWMEPRGGLMLGMSRTMAGGKAVEFEAMRIEERGDSLVFTSKPSRQSETSFQLSDVSESEFVFTNPAHDFPHRVIYGRAADGSLAARIEGEIDGKRRVVEFPLKRVGCDPAPAR
jgi:hypothetical protein